MCGIAAVLGAAARTVGEDFVPRIVAAQSSRGPNGSGFAHGPGYALGHNRLALIDIEGGAQPMASEDGAVVLSFNGEIYNFRELRAELQHLGHRFSTRSDTEVIIQAWIQWGEESLKRLRGMFAFVLVDSRRQCALVARDPFGIKPVFLRRIEEGCIVASDLRAISQALPLRLTGRPLAVELFLRYQYVPEPYTIFNEVERLGPATAMLLDLKTSQSKTWRYHDFAFREDWLPERISSAYAISNARKSIEAHTIADVPYGLFFSGGIDSSFVAAALQDRSRDTQAFTLGVREGNEEEIDLSRRIAKKLGLRQVIEWTDADDEEELLESLRAYGEPFADSSALPCWLLSRRAARSVRMVLSGDGGDEVFGGYGVYRDALELQRSLLAELPGRRTLRWPRGPRLLADGRHSVQSLARKLLQLRLITQDAERRSLYRQEHQLLAAQDDPILAAIAPEWFGRDLVDFAQRLDFERYLPGSVLRKVDVSSMAFGLEVRVPLLDIEVLRSARRLPRSSRVPEYANGREVGKFVLRRELAAQIGGDDAFAWKRGFGTPRRSMARLQSRLGALQENPEAGLFEVLDHGHVRSLHAQALANGREQVSWTLGSLLLWANDHPEVRFL